MRQHLTTTISTFRDLIRENCLYVDKSEYLHRLISKPKGQFFLSRPRRFGKSLTLSSLESFFLGEKELFQGLALGTLQDPWKSYPIISLSLNKIPPGDGKSIAGSLALLIARKAESEGISLQAEGAPAMFEELMYRLYRKSGPVVVLIDEYDKPILDAIIEEEKVADIRTLLKSFYGMIKACEEYLRFTFITGVSKFTQVSIFSDLNNLEDISMKDDFASLCGFTQEEVEHYFEPWIGENLAKSGLSRMEYLEQLKLTYNGIRFTRAPVQVYNPVSLTLAMEEGRFDHYWFSTGTPTFLIKLLKKRFTEPLSKLEDLQLPPEAFTSYEVEEARVEALLYQTGYLTIKEYNEESNIYTLSYPNDEVRRAFLHQLADNFTATPGGRAPSHIEDVKKALLASDIDRVMAILNTFFSGIDYAIKIKREHYYQSIFYIIFSLLGYRIQTEVHTGEGRIDALVKTTEHIFLFEFKLDQKPEKALEQIIKRGYYKQFASDPRKTILVGVNFDSVRGMIGEWKIKHV